jgi:Tol biopolymer transport system component
MKSIRFLVGMILAVALGTSLTLAQSGYDLFQKGLVKERAEGNLQAAIEIFERIVKEFPNNRELAAKALVEMGDCYEKLGKSEAQKTYQRVLRDYADQSAEANEARARLAGLEHGGAQGKEMVTRRLWAGPEVDTEGTVTPDGRYLPHTDWNTGDLAIHDFLTGKDRYLTHIGKWTGEYVDGSLPSPDGKQIAYQWCNRNDTCELRVMGMDGSQPHTVYRNPGTGYFDPLAWSSNGKEIVGNLSTNGENQGQLVIISTVGGPSRVLKGFKPRVAMPPHAVFSPDGRFVAFDLPQSEDSNARDIWIAPAEGGREVPLVKGPGDDYLLGWSPDGGSLVFASDRTGTYGVWLVRMVEDKVQGPPELVKSDTGPVEPLGFSRAGSIYYWLAPSVQNVYVASLDFATGALLQSPALVTQGFTGSNKRPAWSPDGKYLAYLSTRHRRGGIPSWIPDTIVIRSRETGEERELIPKMNIAWIFGIRWSATGRSILFTGGFGNPGVTKSVDIQTEKVSTLIPADPHKPETWVGLVVPTPDGKSLVYSSHNGEKVVSVLIRNLETGDQRELAHVSAPAGISGIALSPDGRQVAFTTQSEPSETSALEVVSTAGGEARELLRLKAPEEFKVFDTLAWTHDGSQIVFGKASTNFKQQKVQLWEVNARNGKLRKLGLSMDGISSLCISPDGHRIAFDAGGIYEEVWVMENFLPTLKASR